MDFRDRDGDRGDPPPTLTRVRALLGTWVAVEAAAGPAAEAAVAAAFAAVERVGRLMHPSADGSDLARVHAAAPGNEIAVDPWTQDCLARALELYAASGGAFDPVVPEGLGDGSDLALPAPNRVRRRAPVTVDLGGIAKGFAIDRAVDAMRAHGIAFGRVNAGGDVRAFGRPAELLVHLGDRTFVHVLDDAALAVSGTAAAPPPEHRGRYLRGRPRAAVPVAVEAPDATTADALTKFVDDPVRDGAATRRLLRGFGARLVDGRPGP